MFCFPLSFFTFEHVEGHVWMVASGKGFAIMLNATEVLALLVQKYNSIYMGLQFTRGQCCPQSPVHGHFFFLHSRVRSIPKKNCNTHSHTHPLSLSYSLTFEGLSCDQKSPLGIFFVFFLFEITARLFFIFILVHNPRHLRRVC